VTAPQNAPTFDVRSGRFSPDGTHLAVMAGSAGPVAAESRGSIVIIDVKHATKQSVARNIPRFDSIAWSADGKQLFFATDSYKKPVTDIGRLDVASRVVQRVRVPFGDGLRFVALSQSEANTFLKAPTGPPSECPSPDIYLRGYLSHRTTPCAFRFTPQRRATTPVARAACPVTKTVKLGSKTGGGYGRASANGKLSILIPRDGSYAAPLNPMGGYDLKVPFYRDHSGHLTIEVKRLDGLGYSGVDMHESSYAPTGFLPTGVFVSDLGCWRITGTQGTQHVSAVIRVTDAGSGPAG